MAKRITGLLMACGMLTVAIWAEAFVVSPARTEVQLKPGDKTKVTLSVTNDSPDLVNVEWDTKDWFLLPANQHLTVDHWITVKGPRTFKLKPGASKKVPVVIGCPKETQGELVGMVSFAFQGEHPSNVLPVISVSVYSEALGTEKVSGSITELAVHRWQDQTQVAIAVQSTGNVHLRPTGSVSVIDLAGRQVALFPIKEGSPVYPAQGRGYFAEDSLKLPVGHYQAKAELNYRDLTLRATKEFDVSKEGEIVLAKGLENLFSSAPGVSTETVKGAIQAQ